MPGVNLGTGQEEQQRQHLVKGACRAYRNDTFRYYLHSLTAFVMFLAFILDCVICKYARKVDFYDNEDSKLAKKESSTAQTTMTTAAIGLKKSTETI